MFMVVIKHILICTLFLLLTACSQSQPNLYDIDTTNLSQLKNAHYNPLTRSSSSRIELGALRMRALEDTAMSIGAQGGLAFASQDLNAQMNKDHKYLDSIFNFNAMMLSHGVLPPVLEEGDFSLNLADPNTIRVADRTYKIVSQARFATTPPNWRDYLILNFTKPAAPNRTLLPKNHEEQKIWSRGVCAGWEKGIEQGYSIFQQNLARLKRDYQGMIIYRKLLQNKMISQPFVARTELGVTGNGTDMRINDQVLRIVEHPQLKTNAKDWHAIVVKRHE